MKWYYVGLDNSCNGPVEEAEMKRLWLMKKIDNETSVWNENMSDWTEIKVLPTLKRKLIPPPPNRIQQKNGYGTR